MKGISYRILPFLLLVTIGVITGFQLFWLKQNYDNEKKTLEVKTGFHFRETVYNLQATQLSQKFGLPLNTKDSIQVEIVEGSKQHDRLIRYNKTREMVSMVNVMRDKKMDSLHNQSSKITITNDDNPNIIFSDSGGSRKLVEENGPAVKFIRLMNGIDSVSDTLSIADIRKSTAEVFTREKINVPITVIISDSARTERGGRNFNEVSLGFGKPVTYTLQLGNSFPYLLRKMTSPIMFSIFLLSVTLASFILLYRNMKQQQRLAMLKNDFISNVTHELKTPIATVNVALEAMKNFNAINDPVKTREYLEISQGELQRLSLLVDKVLRISMFENKEIDLNSEMVDMPALVRDVAASMRLQFEKRSAIVNIKVEGAGVEVMADRLHMMSVVYNLFDNALKYSYEDPLIDVILRDKGNTVELSMADHGIGIPDAYQHKVFDKFFRVPHGDTHNVKGYGLGLSYVSQIVQQHKGTISVTANQEKGTIFKITIPKTNGRH